MYGGVEKWRCKFEEFREMKEREKDPNRYKNNRGKSSLELQKELKRMNLLKRKLPLLEEELINDIEEWQNEHDQPFLVEVIIRIFCKFLINRPYGIINDMLFRVSHSLNILKTNGVSSITERS